MAKIKNNNLITTTILVFVLLILLTGMAYFSLPAIKNTELYKNYESNRVTTFTSERTNFSFKHPNWWPVSAIDFEEEFSSQAGGPSLGFINVEKTKYKDLNEYVEDLSKEETVDMWVKGRTEKVTFTPPKIEYLKIGGVDAISVTDTNTFARFGKETADYRLIRNGLLYRFVTTDSSRFLENKDKNSKTFQQIISSVKFF